MKTMKTLLSLLALLLVTAATAQPAASTLQDGGTYYIYNVKQKLYLADNSGTLTLSSTGTPITITATTTNGYYYMTATSGKLTYSLYDSGVSTDGSAQYDNWRITLVQGKTDTYNIVCRVKEASADFYLQWSSIWERLEMSRVKPDAIYDYANWQLVSEEEYQKSQNIVVLDELATAYTQPTVTASDGVTVHLKRTLTLQSWNTFCVPFAINEAQLKSAFGTDVRVAKYNESDATTLYFTTASTVEAGQLYLIFPTKDRLEGGYYEFTGVTEFDGSQAAAIKTTTVTANPFYYQTTAPQGAYVISQNKVYHLTGDMTMKGFRAYFTENTASGKLTAWSLDGIATGIETIDGDGSDAPIYNIAGQRVSDATAHGGVYIKNGKKLVIRK